MIKLLKNMTIGEKYDPAMEVRTETEAKEYFQALVELSKEDGYSEAEAEVLQLENIGYYAGYFDQETRERVNRLYNTVHPVIKDL